jgi:hypothetical protein
MAGKVEKTPIPHASAIDFLVAVGIGLNRFFLYRVPRLSKPGRGIQ